MDWVWTRELLWPLLWLLLWLLLYWIWFQWDYSWTFVSKNLYYERCPDQHLIFPIKTKVDGSPSYDIYKFQNFFYSAEFFFGCRTNTPTGYFYWNKIKTSRWKIIMITIIVIIKRGDCIVKIRLRAGSVWVFPENLDKIIASLELLNRQRSLRQCHLTRRRYLDVAPFGEGRLRDLAWGQPSQETPAKPRWHHGRSNQRSAGQSAKVELTNDLRSNHDLLTINGLG